MLAIFPPTFAILGCVILVTGLACLLAIIKVVQAAISVRLNGSLIEREGIVFGSPLIAPDFTAPGSFYPRPSADAYGAASAGASILPGVFE